MKYVEVEVFGNQYRLLGSINNLLPLTINGVSYKTPFSDKLNGINIVQIGKSLTFSTNFGLTIQWSSHDFVPRISVWDLVFNCLRNHLDSLCMI